MNDVLKGLYLKSVVLVFTLTFLGACNSTDNSVDNSEDKGGAEIVGSVFEIPSEFELEVGESVVIDEKSGSTIELLGISDGSIRCIKAPCTRFQNENSAQAEPYVTIGFTFPGGCGPDADPRCLGLPASYFEYDLSLTKSTLEHLGYELTLLEIFENSAVFSIDYPDKAKF